MKLTPEQSLYVRSMGKALRVTAIFRTDEEANAFMAQHDEQACVAVFGDLILLADRYDHGIPIPREAVEYARQTARLSSVGGRFL